MTDNDGVLGCVLILLGLPALIIVTTLIDGALLSLGWRWFMVPLGAPALGFWPLVGVALVIRLLRPHGGVSRENEQDVDWSRTLLNGLVVTPILMLGLMALVHWMAAS